MLMNQNLTNSTPVDFDIQVGNNPNPGMATYRAKFPGVENTLFINVNNVNLTGSIDGEETLVYCIDLAGRIVSKITYNLNINQNYGDPVSTPVTPVACFCTHCGRNSEEYMCDPTLTFFCTENGRVGISN